MAKKTCLTPTGARLTAAAPRVGGPVRRGAWPTVLVEMAAANRNDGGLGLHDLLQQAGFADEPVMTIIVKRPARARLVDPHVEDVLDALRALCA